MRKQKPSPASPRKPAAPARTVLTKEQKAFLSTLSEEKKFILADALWCKLNPQFLHKPADNIREFAFSAYFLGLTEVWDSVIDDLEAYYASGKREAWFSEAIGNGKSYKASLIACYEAHKLLCLRNPHDYFHLDRTSKIVILNMGPREAQAKDIEFAMIANKIKASWWFQQFAPPDPNIDSRLVFRDNIEVIPGNSKETTPLGYSIFCAILDEANWYVDNNERDVAREVYYALKRRVYSRFQDYGRTIVISSPKYEGDFISREIKDGVPVSVFFRTRAHWEARPDLYKNDKFIEVEPGIIIPERLVDDYRRNPERFKRDLMALSVGTLVPFFRDVVRIKACFMLQNGWRDGRLAEDFLPKTQRRHYIHIDLGRTKDACGMVMVHPDDAEDVVIADFVARFAVINNVEINFGEVRDVVYLLKARGFNIGMVTLDGWQSADTIQQLTRRGIKAEVLSVDRTLGPYETTKEMAYAGRLRIAKDAVLQRELLQIEMVKGAKVDHPKNGSKDVADGLAGSTYNCVVNEFHRGEVWIPKKQSAADDQSLSPKEIEDKHHKEYVEAAGQRIQDDIKKLLSL